MLDSSEHSYFFYGFYILFSVTESFDDHAYVREYGKKKIIAYKINQIQLIFWHIYIIHALLE